MRRPGLAPASLTNAEFRREQQRRGRKPGRSGLTGKEKLERLGVRFCRVQEKVEDMEILINARGAGFAQGFVKLSCHKRPGRPVLAGEVHRSLVALQRPGPHSHFPPASQPGGPALPPPTLVDTVPPQCSPAKRDGVASGALAGLAPSKMPQQKRPILMERAFRKPPSRARQSPMGSQRAWPWRPSSLLGTHVQMCVTQAVLPAWAGQGEGEDPTTKFTAAEAAGSISPR